MKRIAISIVLNAEEWLKQRATSFYSAFDKWYFIEGAAKSTNCTAWCNQMPAVYHSNGCSVDRTEKIIESLVRQYANIVYIKPSGMWDGKVAMFNEAIKYITEPCYLWQFDADEFWKPAALNHSEEILNNLKMDLGRFSCNYYIYNTDIVARGEWGEAMSNGYNRLWKYTPGRKFISHEPAMIEGCVTTCHPMIMPKFEHYAYYYRKDVEFKSLWYKDHENVLTSFDQIKNGKVKLPFSIETFFGKAVPQAWKPTIITYK